jgi:hypothetical protein
MMLHTDRLYKHLCTNKDNNYMCIILLGAWHIPILREVIGIVNRKRPLLRAVNGVRAGLRVVNHGGCEA